MADDRQPQNVYDERVVEPMPDEDMLRANPEWIRELKRSIFLLVRARRA